MTIADIITNIDQRLVQTRAEVARLEGARQALIDGAPPVAPPKRRRASHSTPAASRRRPRYEAVSADELTVLLDGSEGMSTSELATASDGKRDQILARLRELENADQIRRTGVRRATRWHLITDEERIAARAAQIAAQRRRRPKKSA